ncbi:MAG: DUF2867 domain-containing protein [Wenzhouxiangellaceae bacterium]|nr:DUF2867 domain-containing protein [Wenzhouxiangellaceae bacterium]
MRASPRYMALEIEAAKNFADAAAEARVRRIVYLGGLVPESARSQHILARKRIGETLREGRVPVTEIRAGIVVGPGSAAFEVMRETYTGDDRELQNLIPQTLIDYRQATRKLFESERRQVQYTRWVEGGLNFRGQDHDHTYYAKQAPATAHCNARPEEVWRIICGVGGQNRYFFASLLWRIREAIDWMLGGPGMRYQRPDRNDLQIGDIIDSWRVIALEPGRCLTLTFGMKAPGAGVLEFEAVPGEHGTAVRAIGRHAEALQAGNRPNPNADNQ